MKKSLFHSIKEHKEQFITIQMLMDTIEKYKEENKKEIIKNNKKTDKKMDKLNEKIQKQDDV